jgi:ribosome biogenesis GTPase
VQQAMFDGTLDDARFRSYKKLQQELDYLNRKQDRKADLVEKERWKKITKLQRKNRKR